MSNMIGTFRSYFGAVCVPILDPGNGTISNVTHDWANATANLGAGLAVTVMRLQIKNYRVDIAKERLAEMALQNGVQWLFFLDDDVICPPDTLMKMIKLWRSDPKYKVISGVYWSKSDPSFPLIFRGDLEGSYWDWKTTDLIKADGAGAGCLFIDAEVLKKLPKPWFSCNYNFEDPRSELDLKKWAINDAIGEELLNGDRADMGRVADLERQLKELAKEIEIAKTGYVSPDLMKNKKMDGATTEDLYFYKKVKEELGIDLWIDCSIQCAHQDKRTGRIWSITPDYPQAQPNYMGSHKPGDKVVVDIGAGEPNYWIREGNPIRVDNDPSVKPDILCDARQIPLDNCFADVIHASHILEHFSFRETVTVLKEWIRILKVGGEFNLVVPNMKWAAKRIMDDKMMEEDKERIMFFYHSGQRGDLKSAQDDVHRAGFTKSSMESLIKSLGTLKDVTVYTSDGIGNTKELYAVQDDLGYNIVVHAVKAKHDAPISLKAPLKTQEQAKFHIGEVEKKVKKVSKKAK